MNGHRKGRSGLTRGDNFFERGRQRRKQKTSRQDTFAERPEGNFLAGYFRFYALKGKEYVKINRANIPALLKENHHIYFGCKQNSILTKVSNVTTDGDVVVLLSSEEAAAFAKGNYTFTHVHIGTQKFFCFQVKAYPNLNFLIPPDGHKKFMHEYKLDPKPIKY